MRLLDANKTREAEQLFRAALREDSNNVEALNNLGVTLKREQNFRIAIRSCAEPLALLPKMLVSAAILHRAFYGAGDLESAVSEMTTAVALAPSNRDIVRTAAYYSRDYGIELYRKGRLDASVAALSCEGSAEDSAVHYNLGRVLAKLGREEEAASELSIAEEQNRKSRDAIRASRLTTKAINCCSRETSNKDWTDLHRRSAWRPRPHLALQLWRGGATIGEPDR